MNLIATLPLLFGIGNTELIVIVLVIVLLFGGKKIPELMKGLGKGVQSFKQGLNEAKKEIDNTMDEEPQTKNNPPRQSAKAKDTDE